MNNQVFAAIGGILSIGIIFLILGSVGFVSTYFQLFESHTMMLILWFSKMGLALGFLSLFFAALTYFLGRE